MTIAHLWNSLVASSLLSPEYLRHKIYLLSECPRLRRRWKYLLLIITRTINH